MPKFSVYFRGLIGKIRLLYLSSENKKIKKETLSWLSVGIIYMIGLYLLFFLTTTNSIMYGLICTLIFVFIFTYNVINVDTKYSIDQLLDGLPYMLIMSLIGVLILYSLMAIHRIISITY
jgi:hypothetical protein